MSLILSILLALCLGASAGAVLTASQSATPLSVPIYKQEKSLWCWAASARMAGIYKYWSTDVTQTEIVTHVKGSAVNETGSALEVTMTLSYVTNGVYPGLWSSSPFSFSQVQTSIDNDYPVIPLVYKKSSGHFYVICGYNQPKSQIILNDPWNGARYTCSWSDFCNGNTSGGWIDNRPFSNTAFFDGYHM